MPQRTTGEIINLITSDCRKIRDVTQFCPLSVSLSVSKDVESFDKRICHHTIDSVCRYMWVSVVAPMQIILALYLVHKLIHYLCLSLVWCDRLVDCSAVPTIGMVSVGGHWNTDHVPVAVECQGGNQSALSVH